MSGPVQHMRAVATLVKLDAKLVVRHKLLHVTVLVALVFGALIGFAVPSELSYGGTDYVHDGSEGQRFAALTEAIDEQLVLADEDAVREAVLDDGSSLGIVFRGTAKAPHATVYVQGNESPERLALIHTGVDTMWQLVGMAEGPPLEARAPTVLDPDARKPPFNEQMLPVIYALDLCLLGFMFGSVMILQDKEQGTIRLFRVGPGTSFDYIASKLIVTLGLSLLNLMILTALGAPWALLRPELYLLTILICGGMTLLGMTLAVFLRNIAQWFFPLVAVSLIGTTPVYSMFTPTSSLAWTRFIPTHHMLFGSEAIMFGGAPASVTTALIYGACFMALVAGCCGLAVRGRLLREVH